MPSEFGCYTSVLSQSRWCDSYVGLPLTCPWPARGLMQTRPLSVGPPPCPALSSSTLGLLQSPRICWGWSPRTGPSLLRLSLSLGEEEEIWEEAKCRAEAFSQYGEQAGQRCLRSSQGEKQSPPVGELGFSPIQLEVCPGLDPIRLPGGQRRKPRLSTWFLSARRLCPPHILGREMSMGG